MRRSRSANNRSRSPSVQPSSASGGSVRERDALHHYERSALGTQETSDHEELQMPAFLQLNQSQILAKFRSIQFLELARIREDGKPGSQWETSRTPDDKALDRYLNVLPWAKNRVRLKVPDDTDDYVNASWISVPNEHDTNELHFIAMQGPKATTSDHVWRMVWDEMPNPAVIIMLTKTREFHVDKCHQYFPSGVGETITVNEHDEFGDDFRATVTMVGLDYTDATQMVEVRELSLQVKPRPSRDDSAAAAVAAAPAAKKVHHFFFKAWPDFGVPTGKALQTFLTLIATTRRYSSGKEPSSSSGPPSATSPAATVVNNNTTTGGGGGGGDDEEMMTATGDVVAEASVKDASSVVSAQRGLRLIHCSAGVGRTGTFIALEHLLDELDADVMDPRRRWRRQNSITGGHGHGHGHGNGNGNGSGNGETSLYWADPSHDPIYDAVNGLRRQRRMLVQSEAQYEFLYMVLRRFWEVRYRWGTRRQQQQQQQQQSQRRIASDGDNNGNGTGVMAGEKLEPSWVIAGKAFEDEATGREEEMGLDGADGEGGEGEEGEAATPTTKRSMATETSGAADRRIGGMVMQVTAPSDDEGNDDDVFR